MSDESETFNPLDPIGTLNMMRDVNLKTWKSMRDANMESWSKMMIDLVNSDEYSQATAQWLDTYLTMSQPLQRIIDLTMSQALTALNMPLRTDVTSLAERLTNIEIRLDDQDAKIDNILRAIQALSDANHAVDAPVITPSRSNNGARAHTSTHSVRAKDIDASASNASQTNKTQKKAKGDH
jgi:hypothetical protein